MAKHVIVDGFNVIRRDTELSRIERNNFYGGQEALLRKLAQYRRGTQHRVTVVYDGANGENPYRQKSQKEGVQVIYSARGETADDAILDLVENSGGQRSGVLVVTADRDLASACRNHRVIVVPPESLLQRSQIRDTRPGGAEFWHGKKEEQGWAGHTRKKGNPRRAPKNKRQNKTLW